MAQHSASPQETVIRDVCSRLRVFIAAFGDLSSTPYRESHNISLHTLSNTLPHMTLGEFLNQCEAQATMTLSVALQSGDHSRVTAEIHLLLNIFTTLQIVLSQPRTHYRITDVSLLAVMYQPGVSQSIADILPYLYTTLQLFGPATKQRPLTSIISLLRRNRWVSFIFINVAAIILLFASSNLVLAATSVLSTPHHVLNTVASPTATPVVPQAIATKIVSFPTTVPPQIPDGTVVP